MKDPIYDADRSLTFYVAAERDQQGASEGTLIAWAAFALVLVVLAIILGGCA